MFDENLFVQKKVLWSTDQIQMGMIFHKESSNYDCPCELVRYLWKVMPIAVIIDLV